MTPLALASNTVLSWGIFFLQIALISAVVLLVFRRQDIRYFQRFALFAGFALALLGTTVSLFYSEILNFPACELCWYQRIMLYPQVIILELAWWRRDYGAALYGFTLSVIGAVIGLYQYALQKGLVSASVCEVGSIASDCSKVFVNGLGYITFPLMSATTFIAIALLMGTIVFGNTEELKK